MFLIKIFQYGVKKYNSIESISVRILNEIKVQGFHKLEYVVRKVHGANLSFITNGKDIFN